MMHDSPMLCWKNLLVGSTYAITSGAEDVTAPLSNAWNADTLRAARVTADASGVFSAVVNPSFLDVAYNGGGFDHLPYAMWGIDAIVIGANRHDSAGFRTSGLTWSFAGESFVDIYPENKSFIIAKTIPLAANMLQITLSGAAANQMIVLPELFAGQAIQMPFIDLGFDPYDERSNATSFKSESGREYLSLRYRRLEMKPNWSLVPLDVWGVIDLMREKTLELRSPFWFAWASQSRPHECYLVRHNGANASFPIHSPLYRSLSLNMVEVI